MKIRKGFVSNSSSSAFITCAGCDEMANVGFVSHEEVGFVQCEECEEDFCQSCVESFLCEKELKEFGEFLKDCTQDWSAMPEKFCPSCNLQVVSREEVISCAFKKLDMTEEQLKQELLEKLKERRQHEASKS